MSYAFELRTQFLIEKRNESYNWYDEVSIANKNCVVSQKPQQGSELCSGAGWAVHKS